MFRSKNYKESAKLVDKSAQYEPAEAFELVTKTAKAKFDETVDIAVRLGVDPRKADQMVRGTVALPAGTGKDVRIAVFAAGDAATAAREAGAEFVGADDLAAEVEGGMLDFDLAIATPDQMPVVGRLGKVLGPRGLMPNPKTGTVTPDVKRAVEEIKAGKVEFRVDKTGIIHAPFGKRSFGPEKLSENASALVAAVIKAKPPAAKGKYVKSATVSSTMGPGIRVDENALAGAEE